MATLVKAIQNNKATLTNHETRISALETELVNAKKQIDTLNSQIDNVKNIENLTKNNLNIIYSKIVTFPLLALIVVNLRIAFQKNGWIK